MAVAVFHMKRQRREDNESAIPSNVLYPVDSGAAADDNDNVQELKRLFPQHTSHFLMSILETTHGDLADARCLLVQLAAAQPRQATRRKRMINDPDNEAMTDRRNSDDKGIVHAGMAHQLADSEGGAVAATASHLSIAAGPICSPEKSPEDCAIDSLIDAISRSANVEDARQRLQPLVRDWLLKERVSDTLRRAVLAQTNMLTLAKQRERQSAEARQLLEHEVRSNRMQIEELDRQLRRVRDRNAVLTLFIKTKFDHGGGGSGGASSYDEGGSGGGAYFGGGDLAFHNQDGFAR